MSPDAQTNALVADLREHGHDDLAEFVMGGLGLDALSTDAFRAALADGWVVRLSKDDFEKHIGESTDGQLIQINDKGRSGEFAKAYPCDPAEFADYVYSGSYVVGVIDAETSAFEVSEP